MSKMLDITPVLPSDTPIRVTRDQLTKLLLESHKKASCATEEIMAIKEIGKLHSMYEIKPHVQVNVLNIEKDTRKLEAMSDQALLEMAGSSAQLFEMPPAVGERRGEKRRSKVIEGTCKKVAGD